MKQLLLAALLILGIAVTADADKAITYSTIIASDLVGMHMNRDAAGNVVMELTAKVRGTNGMTYIVHYQATLTGAQATAIANFMTTNFIPAFNTQEGL